MTSGGPEPISPFWARFHTGMWHRCLEQNRVAGTAWFLDHDPRTDTYYRVHVTITEVETFVPMGEEKP